MKKIFWLLFLLSVSLIFPKITFAQNYNSFITVVNPIRGRDFWDLQNQKVETSVKGQAEILQKANIPATWLIRFDALDEKGIIDALSNLLDEKGLFLEVTPSWAKNAQVTYRISKNWHDAGSAFLTGYDRVEREKLIDSAFSEFKKVFGNYPSSVGAWWIDSFSLDYMQKKYGITAALIVSDQYSTDNYQIWGQYFGTPYYPDRQNALRPAQSVQNKISVVLTQWAARDPVNGYGSGVFDSTFSIQANDYIDYHNLDIKYFEKLLDIYTKQNFNSFGQMVVGLENTYEWQKYFPEYQKQIDVISKKRAQDNLEVITLRDFAKWYMKSFPEISPEHLVIAEDPLGSFKKAIWFMNPYFRAAFFINDSGALFRDIRQYVEGEEEICYQKRCSEVNFATFATRVLDEVTYGSKWVIDEGKIANFAVFKLDEKVSIKYKNEAGKERLIELLPRDISVDGKISSIDGTILDVTKHTPDQKEKPALERGFFKWSVLSALYKITLFSIFLLLGVIGPGFVLISRILENENSLFKKLTLSIGFGFVLLTVSFYILGLLNLQKLIFVYLVFNLLIIVKNFKRFQKFRTKLNFGILSIIAAGTLFQQLPVFKNGLQFPYGMGFWGPNTHDGIWHIALINQLTKSIPPQNPIFAGEGLKNYHYFYDLLLAATNYITTIPIVDLLFRFYPVIFSLFLGAGTYYFIQSFFKQRMAAYLALYFVYFAGSFGWIVEFIKFGNLGGESAFWANQSISFNLNPPFAISLILILTILHLLPNLKSKLSVIVLSIIAGTLISFKAYGAILVLLSFFLTGIFKRNLSYLAVFFLSTVLSALLFLSNFSVNKQLFIFSPFWFIHSMVDSPDRVGWVRLSLARYASLEQGNWLKFLTSEIIGFLLFVIGNLGTRVFALLSVLNFKNIVRHQNSFFLLTFSLLSFLIPVFLIQSGNPWNTIQFIYYGLFISALVSAVVLTKAVKRRKIMILVILPIITITPINSWATANGYLSYQPHGYVSNRELEALEFLKSKGDGIVLTYPYDGRLKTKLAEPWPLFVYDSTAYVSALSSKATFIEDEGQNQVLLTDYKKRLVASKDFFQKPEREFLEINSIRYIYLPKMFNININEDLFFVKNIFENEEAIVYEVNK